MYIKKMYIVNRENHSIESLQDIDTDEMTVGEFADLLCDTVLYDSGYDMYAVDYIGKWDDSTIEIDLMDTDGNDWIVIVDLEHADVTIERR